MMSDLNLKVAEALGFRLVETTVNYLNTLHNPPTPYPVQVWLIVPPEGWEFKFEQHFGSKSDAVDHLPDWEHDANKSLKLIEGLSYRHTHSPNRPLSLHDVAIWRDVGIDSYYGQGDTLPIAICEAWLKYIKAFLDLNLNADPNG